MNPEKIEKIQQEINQLFQKQLQLLEAHHQRVKAYQQKTHGHHADINPELFPDPKLQMVSSKIEDLKENKRRIYDILQAAASVSSPDTEWSNSPFYSETLNAWNFNTSSDQMGFYVTFFTSIGVISKALWRSWNIRKAVEIVEKGEENEMFSFHRYYSGITNEEMKHAVAMRRIIKFKAFAFTGLLMGTFTAFVQFKNRNRFKK